MTTCSNNPTPAWLVQVSARVPLVVQNVNSGTAGGVPTRVPIHVELIRFLFFLLVDVMIPVVVQVSTSLQQ